MISIHGNALSAGSVLSESDAERDKRIFNEVLVRRTALKAERNERELVSRALALANMVKSRTATLADLVLYNELAIAHWKTNLEFYRELARAGAKFSENDIPWQPPMWGDVSVPFFKCVTTTGGCDVRATVAGANGQIDFTKLKLTMGPQYLPTFEGFAFAKKPDFAFTLDGLDFLPVLVVWAGVALIGAIGLSYAISNVMDAVNGVEIKRLEAEYNKQAPKYGATAMDKLQSCADALVKQGIDPLQARKQCGIDVARVFPQVALPEHSQSLTQTVTDAVKLGLLLGGGLWLFKYYRERQGQ